MRKLTSLHRDIRTLSKEDRRVLSGAYGKPIWIPVTGLLCECRSPHYFTYGKPSEADVWPMFEMGCPYDSDTATLISVKALLPFSPLSFNAWGCDRISEEEVNIAVQAGNLNAGSYSESLWAPIAPEWSRRDHIFRIAYLVKNRDYTPIHVDVGLQDPRLDLRHPITDGNHRLAAAIVRGDDYIRAYVCGAVSVIRELGLDGKVLGRADRPELTPGDPG